MADQKFELSQDKLEKAMYADSTRAGLRSIADRIERRANTLSQSESVMMDIHVEESIRPQGRPQAVVYGNNSPDHRPRDRGVRYGLMTRAARESI